MLFTAEQLTRVVDKRRPVATPIRDRHFPVRSQYGTPHIGVDIKTGPEGIAVAISHGVESTRAARDGWQHLTLEIPRFSEHDIIKAADLVGLRAPGQTGPSEAMMMRYNDKLDLIRTRFDRTLEFMCLGALKGTVTDGAGATLVTYAVPGAASVTFNAASGGDNPFDEFRAAVRTLSRALGGPVGQVYAYCGDTAYDLLMNQHQVVAARASVGGNVEVGVGSGGNVERVGTVLVENYPYVYADAAGVDQPFVATNEILLVPSAIGGEILLGPCETPTGLVLQEWFVDTWQERDPAATRVRLETNRLPLVRRPDAIARFTVSGS